MKKTKTKPLSPFIIYSITLLLAVFFLPAPRAVADDTTPEFYRPKNPGFRTDIGIHISAGSHHCLNDGSGYASCGKDGGGWNAGWGLALGALVRPFTHLSFGLDASFMNMSNTHNLDNHWLEVAIGPVARVHLPIRFGKFVMEPNLGAQAGFVQGTMWIADTSDESQKRKLYGPFVGIVCHLDLFVLPGFGVGLDIRIHRVFYLEVCTGADDSLACRGLEDEKSVRYLDGLEGENRADSGDETGVAFPWKIYYGGHLVYYF